MGSVATRFYLIFQQHTNAYSSSNAGLITSSTGKGYSIIAHCGQRVLLVAPDTRSERSKETVISQETYDLLDLEIRKQILPTTRHIVVVLGTPIVYPKLTMVENALDRLGDTLSRQGPLGQIFGKYKTFDNILGDFGPELLDDLVDSWACEIHQEEKKKFIGVLQAIAAEKNVRFSFISGDVHVGGAGRLFSTVGTDERRDPYHMVQIVSSAIVNGPPPAAVIKNLHFSAATYQVNDYTSEEMIDIFNYDVDGTELETKKLLNRRNWCEVRELEGYEVEFTICVEELDHTGSKKYPLVVNRLEKIGGV